MVVLLDTVAVVRTWVASADVVMNIHDREHQALYHRGTVDCYNQASLPNDTNFSMCCLHNVL